MRSPSTVSRTLLVLAAAALAAGCGASGARFTLLEENDVFNLGEGYDTDQDYTQGARFAATLPSEDTPGWAKRIAEALPNFSRGAPVHLGVLLGQEIYTPEDRTAFVPALDDRPYAAWAFFGVAIQSPLLDPDASRSRDRLDTVELDLGVVGPSALGEDAQNAFHRYFGISEANGWDFQLRNEPAALLTVERRWRADRAELGGPGGFAADAIPFLRARAGTVRMDATAGFLARIGWNLPRDFGPLAVDSHGLGREASGDAPWALIQVGGDARGVVHDIFLEGGYLENRHDVTPTNLVWSPTAGLSLGWGPFTAHYGQTWVSHQFRERRRFHQVSTILVSVTVRF